MEQDFVDIVSEYDDDDDFEADVVWDGHIIPIRINADLGLVVNVYKFLGALGITPIPIDLFQACRKGGYGLFAVGGDDHEENGDADDSSDAKDQRFFTKLESILQGLQAKAIDLQHVDWKAFSAHLYVACREAIHSKKTELDERIRDLQIDKKNLDKLLSLYPPGGRFPLNNLLTNILQSNKRARDTQGGNEEEARKDDEEKRATKRIRTQQEDVTV